MNSAGVKYEDHELDKLIFLEQGFAVSFFTGASKWSAEIATFFARVQYPF